MKKLSAIIALVLMISLLLCASASAQTITAMAMEINPDHLERTSCYARILDYNTEQNILTVELIEPETFNRDDILSLTPGDSIWSDGHEIKVAAIKFGKDNRWAIINDWETEDVGETLELKVDINRNFVPVDDDNYTWRTAAVLEIPVTESLLLLDYFDSSRGETVFLPIVYSADQFIDMLLSHSDHVGFAADNVYVVFDGEGNLAAIHRFYVPWQ